ncbi:MAG: hypothetical protein LBL97_04850 [Prevotellaceae bacterium]|jgi:hypothetical protein|nr:hypothetical protein [Prevotellaceae bacterium]
MRLTKTKETAGKFLLDIAKLVIGGVILAGVMQQGISHVNLYIYGGLFTTFCIIVGFVLITLSDRDNNKEDSV